MQHIEQGTVDNYLAFKGLNRETLQKFSVLIMENGKFSNYNDCPWAKKEYSLLKFKREKYIAEGCKEAIFIPVFDFTGNLVGIVMRLMCSQKHDSYFKDNISKTKILFNLNNAYRDILRLNRVFITEGCPDTLALSKCGITNSVALLGTNITDYHIFMLNCLTDNIILVLDSDNAGWKACLKAKQKSKGKMNVFRVKLPYGLDADEYLKNHTTKEFFSLIKVL